MSEQKQMTETQERMNNCAQEVLAVLHKYDCVLSIQTQIDCNGNTNSGIGIIPINREIKISPQVVDQEDLEKEEELVNEE